MDYKDLPNEALYEIVKMKVPEIPVNKVDKANRKKVIAVLQVMERIKKRKGALAA